MGHDQPRKMRLIETRLRDGKCVTISNHHPPSCAHNSEWMLPDAKSIAQMLNV